MAVLTRIRASPTLLATLLIAGALLAACGEQDDPGTGNVAASPPSTTAASASPDARGGIAHPTGTDALVLRVEHRFMGGPPRIGERFPAFSLYGDGCFIVGGPTAGDPAPVLPNLLETCLTEDGMQRILTRARDARLMDGDAEHDFTPLGTLSSIQLVTTFTVNASGNTFVATAYDLNVDATPVVDPDGAGRVLVEFERSLSDPASWLPAEDIVTPQHPYQAMRIQITVSVPLAPMADAPVPVTPAPESWRGAATLAWSLALPLGAFGAPAADTSARCGVVEGADVAPLLAQLARANDLTRWLSAGQEYFIGVRPLLPDERDCQDLLSR